MFSTYTTTTFFVREPGSDTLFLSPTYRAGDDDILLAVYCFIARSIGQLKAKFKTPPVDLEHANKVGRDIEKEGSWGGIHGRFVP